MATGHFYKTAANITAALNNSAGSLIAVLDEALEVDTGALGWEKPYSGTNIGVYRATTGNRHYLRVQDTLTQTAYVRMFETMTDENTGTGPCPNGSPQSTGWMRAIKANAGGDYHFIIVGDSRYFAMLIRHYHGGSYINYAPLIFGEFNSFDPLDSYNTILVGAATSSDSAAYGQYTRSFLTNHTTLAMADSTSYVGTVDNTGSQIIKSPDGLISSSSALIHDPFGSMWNSGRGRRGLAHFGSSPAVVYAPFYIFDTNGAASQNMNYGAASYGSNGYIRGTLPYLYSSPYVGSTGASNFTDGASSFGALSYIQTQEYIASLDNHNVLFFRTSNDEPGRV